MNTVDWPWETWRKSLMCLNVENGLEKQNVWVCFTFQRQYTLAATAKLPVCSNYYPVWVWLVHVWNTSRHKTIPIANDNSYSALTIHTTAARLMLRHKTQNGLQSGSEYSLTHNGSFWTQIFPGSITCTGTDNETENKQEKIHPKTQRNR